MWKDRTIDLSTPFPYTEPWNEEEWLNSIDWDGGERPTQKQLEAYMDTKAHQRLLTNMPYRARSLLSFGSEW